MVLRLKLEDWRNVFVAVCLVSVLVAAYPIYGIFIPERPVEKFIALGLLGENGMAEHYYPSDDPNIGVGVPVKWFVYLYNHMGEAEYVALRVRLLNATVPAPNSTSCTACPAPFFIEVRRILLKNETLVFPFSWSLEEATKVGDFVRIERLNVNNVRVASNSTALYGYNFRMIFELWIYNEDSQDFGFGWSSGGESRCVWNQIWFNVTMTK